MEVAPDFWQSPETLRDIYVSTTGGTVSGTQATRRRAAPSSSPTPPPAPRRASRQHVRQATTPPMPRPSGSGRSGAQPAAQCPHQHRRGRRLRPAPRSRPGSKPWCRCRPSHYGPGTTPLSVNHQGAFVATTFSFNLPDGVPLGQAHGRHPTAPWRKIHVPISVHGESAGTAQLFQKSLRQPAAAAAGGDRDHLYRAGHAV